MAFQQTTVRKEDPDEGFVDVFAVKDDKTGDIYTQTKIQKEADDYGISYINGFKNEKTGDIYEILYNPINEDESTPYPGKLLASNAALTNPDIQGLINSVENFRGFSSNPGAKYGNFEVAQQLYDLKQSNPNAYYSQLAADLGNQIAENNAYNKGQYNGVFEKQLNQIKEINPAAYYSAELGILGDSVGWQIGQNRSDRNAPTIEKIQSLIPDAMAAGLSAEQINSIVNSSANSANIQNQIRIANDAAAGGSGFNFGRDLAPALAIFGGAVGGAALGGAFSGAGALGSGAGGLTAASIPSLTTGLEVGVGSALAGTGAGAAAVPAGGALSSLGSLAFVPPAIGGSAGFLAPTLGADLASTGLGLNAAQVPNLIGGLEVGTGGVLGQNPFTSGLEQMGPTYQELGVTGVEGGQMGPTYNELGYTGLNQNQAIAAADAAASSGLLSNVGDVLKGTQLAKGLLGGTQQPQQQAPIQTPKSIMPRGQVDYSGILNLLQTRQQRNPYSLLG